MKSLSIRSPYPCEVTVIPNRFFDEYMPRANGEFVKVYFYLLRMTNCQEAPSLCEIADRLNYTEQDVLRALRYWEKEGILALRFDEDGSLSDILLINICGSSSVSRDKTLAQTQAMLQADRTPVEEAPARKPQELPQVSSERRVSPARTKELSTNEDIREMLFVAQQYMGKPLTPGELQKLLYFYDELHFSTDLITFLVEYCVEKQHNNMRYIEKVALNWYNEGITTVREARLTISAYRKDYYDILKALGITGRNPIDAEIAIMKKWIDSYGFAMDIINEACSRTILNTKKPSLQYADGILTSWHQKNVLTLDDISKLDAAHEAAKASANDSSDASASPNGRAGSKNTKFNDFKQRNIDYKSLEQKLLNM